MPFSSVTVNVTETCPAGSDATPPPRISLTRPAPATCVGGGVGEAVGVWVGDGPFEPPPSPHAPAVRARPTNRMASGAVLERFVALRCTAFIARPRLSKAPLRSQMRSVYRVPRVQIKASALFRLPIAVANPSELS